MRGDFILDKEKNSLRKNLRIFLILNIGIFLISLAYVIYFSITEGTELFPPCYFKERFKLYCPGCGGSRSLRAFFSFDFIKSFLYYPPIIISSLVILYYDIRLLLTLIKKDTKYTDNYKFYEFIIIPAVIILTFIIRNILLLKFGYDPIGDFV